MTKSSGLLVCLTLFGLAACGTEPTMDEFAPIPVPTEVSETPRGDIPTYVGNVIVTNRTELEALRGYVVIQGNVFINPLMVTDLEPLSSLERIEGTLDIAYDRIQVQSLKSLFGLHHLRAR